MPNYHTQQPQPCICSDGETASEKVISFAKENKCNTVLKVILYGRNQDKEEYQIIKATEGDIFAYQNGAENILCLYSLADKNYLNRKLIVIKSKIEV